MLASLPCDGMLCSQHTDDNVYYAPSRENLIKKCVLNSITPTLRPTRAATTMTSAGQSINCCGRGGSILRIRHVCTGALAAELLLPLHKNTAANNKNTITTTRTATATREAKNKSKIAAKAA